MKFLLLFLLCLLLSSSREGRGMAWLPGEWRVVFQIGELDNSPNEFALAPNEANRFKQFFPQDPIYIVGRSQPKDFPFIHPSEADILWGGEPQHTFTIKFELEEDLGESLLLLVLYDVHESLAPTMEVSINGRVKSVKVRTGKGRAYFGTGGGETQFLAFPVEKGILRRGGNEINITLKGGSWVAYDAVILYEVKGRIPPPPPPFPLRPLHNPLSPSDLAGRGVLLGDEPFRCLFINPGDYLQTTFPLPNGDFSLDFYLYLPRGEILLSYTLPQPEMGKGWEFRLRGREGWQRISLRNSSRGVSLEARDEKGRILGRWGAFPSFAPSGYLRWEGGEPGQFFLSHLFYTTPISFKWGRITKKEVERKMKIGFAVENEYLRLGFGEDTFGPLELLDKKHDILFADSPYIFYINDEIRGTPSLKKMEKGEERVVLTGRLGDVEITQEFRLPRGKPYLEERITLENKGDKPISSPHLGFGFARVLARGGKLMEGMEEWRVVAVPYRRELQGQVGEYEDYPLSDLLWRKGWYRPVWNEKAYTEEWGGEGWILTNHKVSLLIVKHNNEAMEYSLLKAVRKGEEVLLRFGGAGVWHDDPECARELKPGQKLDFGTTRYALVEGGWQEAYYAFREFMEEMGHKVPKDYDPPIHWNELYDNPLWWGPDTPQRRKECYSLPQMLEEAEKARELGCEALYLDPGWDTSFASSIWAEDRLLKAEEFVRLMWEKYGLLVALHTPLAGWSDITAYPYECRRKDKNGDVLPALCGGSERYIQEKARRLIELARAGVVFFMFDGSAYTGECYDANHGHPIPYTREAHCRSILRLAQLIKREFSQVLIELHDPILAGVPARYAPTYYLHALPRSFDEVWAFEYMWDPMEDLLSGRAISLYYYNLAYSLPLYIHIDLRKDNENCLEFWWYASTCRHLGVGGRHPREEVWEAHKRAMREYKRLKRFYTQGIFYGLDETVHIHSLPGEGAVVNVFNLEDKRVERTISLDLEEIGLKGEVEVKGGDFYREGSKLFIPLDLSPRGALLIEIREVRSKRVSNQNS